MGGDAYTAEALSVHASATRCAALTDPRHPLDADTLSLLHSSILSARAQLDNLADALVAAYLAGLRGVGEGGPGVHHDAHVGVADTCMGAEDWSACCKIARVVETGRA